ncbi:MAG TPA: holo-ACP synthase [Clostridiales bacterium]|nr:holo-ACP synthase [Clostridiales bacterium]
MIVGVGIDLIEIKRVTDACKKERFIVEVFTEDERKIIDLDIIKAADNFAVKEAVVKMLGTGFRKIKAIEIEVLRNEMGKPYVNLYGEALNEANKQMVNKIHVSISNTKEYSNAFVVGESI